MRKILEVFMTIGIIIGLCLLFAIFDYYFIFDGIKSKTPIIPKIELVIENNKVDTLYVYELKQQVE